MASLAGLVTSFNRAATAANGRVVFAPYKADCVGVFDAASDAFSCVDISSTFGVTCRTCYKF